MKRLILIVLLALPASASASDFYFAQSSAGSNNGTSCANAYAYNDGTNGWNTAGKQTAGNTLHVCGTFTGSANQSPLLTFSHSGSSGNPITLIFESGAILQAPYFSNSEGGTTGGAITLGNGQSWITINGNGVGVIQNTANGSSLANQQPSTAISGFGCSHCTITSLTIANMYVNVTNSGTLGDNSVVRAIDFNGSNWNITNNTIHDCGWCIFDSYANGDTNDNVSFNDVSAMGHGMMYAAASAVASVAPALFFHDNLIHDTVNWQATGCPFHQDGIHTFGVTGSTMDGIYVYNNVFDGDWGTCPTGFIFVEFGGGGGGTPSNMKNSFWFNNVGIVVNTGFVNTNGWFNVSSGITGGATKIFNNTIIGDNATDNSACIVTGNLNSLSVENNAVAPCGSPMRIDSSTIAILNNDFYGASCQNGGNCFVFNSSFTGSFSAWKTATGGDGSGLQNNTSKLNSDGTPQSGSPVIGLGANLFSTCNGQPNPGLGALCLDKAGVMRPSSGAWDAGAFQFNTTPTVATPTFSPVAGTYTSTQSVAISTTTGGATICYTTDGSTPTANGAGTCTHGTTYSSAVSVAVSETLKAVGSLSGDTDSSVGSATYTIQVATPTFSPVAGTYTGTQNVTISTTTGSATLCYTTDGTTPTANGAGTCTHGTTYSTAVAVAASETLKAVGSLSGLSDSAVGSAAYIINNTAPIAPAASLFAHR